jgi:hypothetical protein
MYDLYAFWQTYLYILLSFHDRDCQSPDLAQEAMEDLLRSFKAADVSINAIGVFSYAWSYHQLSFLFSKDIASLRGVTTPLPIILKIEETDWLGYWVPPKGLQPWQ